MRCYVQNLIVFFFAKKSVDDHWEVVQPTLD
jgi:hypothetical protein